MADIRKQLLCLFCSGPLYPPILTCERGDALCRNCRNSHKTCPVCNKPFTSKRDDVLEKLANLPCFSCNNCGNSQLRWAEMKDHELVCSAKTIPNNSNVDVSCPLEKCDWKGPPIDLFAHWKNKNMKLQSFGESFISKLKLNSEYFVNMLEAYGSKFVFRSRREDDKFFWALQYIGKAEEAKRYIYEVEIFNRKQPENKFVMTSYCQSIFLEKEALYKAGVCIFTLKEMLQTYVAADDILLYNLKVKMADAKHVEGQLKKIQKYLQKYNIS